MWNAFIATAILAQVGCGGPRGDDASATDSAPVASIPPAPSETTAVVPPPAPPAPSDADILGSINARDANLIEASTMAKDKAGTREIRDVAAKVLASHQASLTRGGELAKQLNLSRELPPDSAMARMQRTSMDRLAVESGGTFDHSYMQFLRESYDAELQKVLQSQLDAAQHAEVKAFVTERLAALQDHRAVVSSWLDKHPG